VKPDQLSRSILRTLALGSVALLTLSLAAPARGSTPQTRFNRVDLVSDQVGKAPLVDPDLVDAWGMSMGPAGPLWVTNNGTNTSTLYAGGIDGATPTKPALVVTIPGSAAIGQVFNDTTGFVVSTPDGKSGPARFLFAGEGGDITGWSPATSTPTAAILAAHVDGAVYRGLAILHAGAHAFLLAPDFHNKRVDVFAEDFSRVPVLSRAFSDPRLPSDYAPFNVTVAGGDVYVAYAKQSSNGVDEQAGRGLGFVDRFPGDGGPMQRIASRGTLNAPWGLAIAPASFGDFAGAVLVGNFGDGRIGAYRGGHFLGLLRDNTGKPIVIDGLWALLPGTATTGGTGSLWFSAGPDGEAHGLVGEILPATTTP
jgi:uncharacterized protein (TIGR03118 family)